MIFWRTILRNLIFQKTDKNYARDEEAFRNRSGVCYTDASGKQYTYEDLLYITGSEEAAEYCFRHLFDDHLEESLDDNWHFRKCGRCGNWMFLPDVMFMKKTDWICEKCRPVKTGGWIVPERDPYDDDRVFYHKRKVRFRPGITTLVGCNGIGKTTLLQRINNELSSKGVPVFLFDNDGDDGGGKPFDMLGKVLSGLGNAAAGEDMGMAVTMYASSEGERIRNALVLFTRKLMNRVRKYEGFGEYWILFDAIDSGLSLDVIDDVKQYLFAAIMEQMPENADVYIVSSSNSYELSEGTLMFSVAEMKYMNIRTYDAYRKAVYRSLEYKEKRDRVLEIRWTIRHAPYDFFVDEEALLRYNDHKNVICDRLFEMCLYDLCLRVSVCQDDERDYIFYRLYQKQGDFLVFTDRKIPFDEYGWSLSADRMKESMHDVLCDLVYKDRKQKGTLEEVLEA